MVGIDPAFLLLLGSKIEALRARKLASWVLVRLGLERNEKKQWEPTQLVKHLRLEVDLKAGQFRATPARPQKIHLQAKALLREASRQRREHFVISTKRGWGAKVELSRQAWSDIEWWLRLPAQSPTRAKLRHFHITHLELEAVYKMAQSFERARWQGARGYGRRGGDPTPEQGPLYSQQAGKSESLGASSWDGVMFRISASRIGSKTLGNYQPKARAFMAFCEDWLPAAGAIVRLYIAQLLDKGTVQAVIMQPYLSAINNYHEDMGFPGPAKSRAVSRAVKGISSLQVQAADAAEELTVRTYLPARHVSAVHAHGLGWSRWAGQLRSCSEHVCLPLSPSASVSMHREHINIIGDQISVVLHKEKGRGHVRLHRRLTIPAAGVAGLV
ncbi:hypothetical protein CYMTET_37252 [Cymbomonas tetramitiformis]|uniref:Uncharacterized protein n=1 Tax=Cymbomonas tetramitiformis TaxID=36881 RepID=A0AAE0CG45_9CHLO|nr:hypothetical protein CYMTET_37252 [Cymbomonas tetramitiformis]